MNQILPYCLLICSVTIASFSQILLKKSAMKTYRAPIYEYLNPFVVIGYGMTFCSMLLSIIAYRMVDYKNGPLIESMGFVIVMFLSLRFFGEKITKRKLLGSLFIVAGIVVFYL